MFNGVFAGLNTHELASLVSCLVFCEKTNDEVALSGQLAGPLGHLQVRTGACRGRRGNWRGGGPSRGASVCTWPAASSAFCSLEGPPFLPPRRSPAPPANP
jgi:hypothetical protein